MLLLDKIREFIARKHAEHRGVEITVAAGRDGVDVHVDHYRTMTPAERADTLAVAHDKWADDNNGEDLAYKTSLVDLMKLVRLDSSLKNRQKLAAEAGWDGDVKDTSDASTSRMNQYLMPLVLKKLEIVY